MDLQQAIFRDCFHSWKRWITCGVLWWGGGVLQFCWKRTMKGAWCRYPVPKARWFFYETEAWSSKSNCSEKHALPIASVYGIYIYIYQHLLHSYIYIHGKCWKIHHTWMLSMISELPELTATKCQKPNSYCSKRLDYLSTFTIKKVNLTC